MAPLGSRVRIAALACCVCLTATLVAGVAVGALPSSANGDVTPAVGDDSLQVVDIGNTSNYLQPDRGPEIRDATTYQDIEVGTTVALGADTFEGRHDRIAFDRRYRSAPNDTARLELIRSAVDDLEGRSARLRDAHEEARTSFRDGSISADAYLRSVARLDAAGESTSSFRDYLEGRIGQIGSAGQPSFETIQALEADVETMDGPVAERIRARFAGNASAGATMVTVTDDGGFVHAMVDGDRFYRVAQEGPDWDRNGQDQFASDGGGGLNEAINRASQLYPWTWTSQVGSPPPRGVFAGTSLYKFGFAHKHGELTLYLDGSTGDAFREVQEKRLASVPTTWQRSATTDDLAVQLNGTHPTGPVEVVVTQPDGDRGVDAAVTIDDTDVGTTGSDGRLWAVQPPEDFSVNATASDGRSVDLTLPESPGSDEEQG